MKNLKEALLLYVIPDRIIGAPLSLEEQTLCALQGGATAIQLRDKHMAGKELYSTASRMSALCRKYRALFIVNDRLDIALACGADGVHLGQNDFPVREARKLAKHPFIIGTSARTVDETQKAEYDGADYLGFGAVFPTHSKEDASTIGLERLNVLTRSTRLPSVAIGGITHENLASIMTQHLSGVAVISAAIKGNVPEQTARLLTLLNNLRKSLADEKAQNQGQPA